MFTCEVSYKGQFHPVMEWSIGGFRISEDDIIDESIAGQLTKTSIVVEASADKLGYKYQCETKFNPPDAPGEDFADNAPNYTYDFETDALDIHCNNIILY